MVGGVVRSVANLYGRKVSRAYLLSSSEADEIIDSSLRLALGPCTCRAVFHHCDNMINAEIMVGTSQNLFIEERPHDYREITKEEAKDILRQCHQRGLIHTIIQCRQDLYAICNCCLCCCVPLRLNKKYGIGRALSRTEDIVSQFKEQMRRVETV